VGNSAEAVTGHVLSMADMPTGATLIHVLGVDYIHLITDAGGDLYLTRYGAPHMRHLQPDRWFAPAWFQSQREKLDGSGSVYALPTKPLDGQNLGLVVKYSRVGERVPIDTKVIEDALSCEFNGPFEEFALLEDLRSNQRGPASLVVETQLPLAIYVPPERWQPSQLQRFQWRIARKVALHPGIAIDIMREYILVYRWLSGIDAWEAHQCGLLSRTELDELDGRAIRETRAKGFSVLDTKPEHLIVRMAGPGTLERDGEVLRYGLVDFELLTRTTEYYQELLASSGAAYQSRRASVVATSDVPSEEAPPMPPGRRLERIFGVDYVHGRTESTGGMLWVVGRDPELFDYFLPERWRTTEQIRSLKTHDTYVTTSKDGVRLVWKVSRVGERGEVAAFGAAGFRALTHGFNSPFEEVALACRIRRHGIRTIEPLAVYRTGSRTKLDESLFDSSRYQSHAHLLACDDEPILARRFNYVTLWEHWNGSQEAPAVVGQGVSFRSLNLAQATSRQLVSKEEANAQVDTLRDRLNGLGVEVIRIVPSHLLVAMGADDTLVRDEAGRLETCLCNFQYLSWPLGEE